MRDRNQQLVADVVAVGVVDPLEVVEVGEQNAHRGARPRCPQCRVVKSLLQQGTVR